MARHARILLIISGLVLLFSGCSRTRAPALSRETLFSLGFGKMEDQVELFMNGRAINRKTSIVMRDGLFRIASGYGNKVMELTSYGDLISLYYNPDANPTPVLLEPPSEPGRTSNRQAFAFPFNVVGSIAVSPDGYLLVEDQVPARIAEYDEELGTMLNRVVVRFDQDGNQVDYLGQEGIGGTYLPYIKRIHTTANGDVVVVAVAPPFTIVFWYDADGTLLRRIDFSPEIYPVPGDRQALPVLEAVFPDREYRRLYAKFNYHLVADEAAPADEPGVMSRIYALDIRDGAYTGYVDVPRYTAHDLMARDRDDETEYQYELLGTAPGEHLYLLSPEVEGQSQLLILNANGRVVRRRTLEVDSEEVIYRDLHISDSGILSGLLATRAEVEIVWWRTDKLLPGSVR